LQVVQKKLKKKVCTGAATGLPQIWYISKNCFCPKNNKAVHPTVSIGKIKSYSAVEAAQRKYSTFIIIVSARKLGYT